jgi:RNA polymerase sigma-70 factor (ECF subfamily)
MEERELVELSQKGDEEAFSALVKKYKAKVFNLAFSFTQDKALADDLAQEVFIKAFFGLPEFRFKSEFGTWLFRITVNHVKDYLRKKSRIRKMTFENFRESQLAEEDEVTRKEKEQIMEQRRKLVFHCLQTLPEKYKVILTLRDIQGFRYEEISKILKISPGTVDSRLHRARKMLREKLAPFLSDKGGIHEMQKS